MGWIESGLEERRIEAIEIGIDGPEKEPGWMGWW